MPVTECACVITLLLIEGTLWVLAIGDLFRFLLGESSWLELL